MDKFVVKLREFGDPSPLAIVEFLGFSEVQEVQMIGIDLNLMWGSVKVMSPFSQGPNNAEELSIVDFVSSFSGIEGFRKKENWMASSSRVHLREDRP
jgi:hypothetical protein